MARYLPVSRSALAGKGWRKYESYAFAATEVAVPLLLEEVTQATASMPIGLRRASDDSPFELVALLSALPNDNFFVGPEGRWLGGYVPAQFRGYPFRLVPEESSDRQVMCFDLDSGLLVEDGIGDGNVTPFFTADGEPSPDIKRTLAFLEQCEKSRQRTAAVINELVPFQLIVPWELKVQVPGIDEPMQVEGLYRVDPDALNRLPGVSLEFLSRRGALALAYAQVFSRARLPGLARLAQLREKLHQAASPSPVSLDLDLDSLFGEHGENIRFDA